MNNREEYLSRVKNKKDPYKENREILIYSLVLAVYLFLSVFLNAYILTTVIVDGESMTPSLQDTDVLYMNMLKSPSYDDIIIVKPYDNKDEWYIKRVAGLEGDTVYWEHGYTESEGGADVKYGNIYRKTANSAAIKIRENVREKTSFTSVTVGVGQVFFLGDNINNSTDSRSVGCRRLSDVIGVVPGWSVKHKGNISKLFYFLNPSLKQS